MKEILIIIDTIIKYGLNPEVAIDDKEKDLEKQLVCLYSLYFDVSFIFDGNDYSEFDKSLLPNIRQNVISNFKDFGFYHNLSNVADANFKTEVIVEDAIDDLTDIIIDLLEVKWRAENNSLNDALWYFKEQFDSHTKPHILGLLNYMNEKNG